MKPIYNALDVLLLIVAGMTSYFMYKDGCTDSWKYLIAASVTFFICICLAIINILVTLS